MPLIVVVLCILFLGGCATAGWQDQVRTQASHDHRCPQRKVRVVDDDGDRRARKVTLVVCGKRVRYRDTANLESRSGRRQSKRRWRRLRRRRRPPRDRRARRRRRPPRDVRARRPRRPRPEAGRKRTVERRTERERRADAEVSREERAEAPRQKRRRRRRSKHRTCPDAPRVKRVMKVAFPQLTACYDRAVRRNPALAGVVVLRFTLAKTGRVDESGVASNTISTAVGDCMVDVVKQLRFPPLKRGRTTYHYPYVFKAPQ